MYNKIFKAVLIFCAIANTCACHAEGLGKMENIEKILEEFNALSSTLDGNYSYDSIKKIVSKQDEFLIIAKLNTHPIAVEAMIVVNEKKPDFLYLSSEYNRTVSCSSTEKTFNLDIASEQRLSAIEDIAAEIHPYYTVIEKRKGGVNSLFAFSSYYNESLRREVDSLESYVLRAMLNICPSVKIE